MPKIGTTLAPRTPLVRRLLLVDGISRSGKFLAANLLNGMREIEPVQLRGLLENIPCLYRLGLVRKAAAQELLHLEIDMQCYEMLIGRNLNHRVFDKSSVFRTADPAGYLARAQEPDVERALARYHQTRAYSLFLVHEVLPDLGIYLDSFPELKVISMRRSPVDLVYSWNSRKAVERLGSDPRMFWLGIQAAGVMLPWYMRSRADEYARLGPMDRTIAVIDTLCKRYARAERGLSVADRRKILFVKYETMMAKPSRVVRAMSAFLGKRPTQAMPEILTRERLPGDGAGPPRADRLAVIRAHASPRYWRRLMALEEAYTARHGRD